MTAAAALTAVSCGRGGIEPIKETGATLEGKVTYGNEQVPMAMVIVAQTGGGSATAFADDEGNYKVENVPVGDVNVAVNTDATKGMMTGRAMAGTDPKSKSGGKKGGTPKLVEVPKKYHSPDTSGITTKTQKGSNQYDVKIPKLPPD